MVAEYTYKLKYQKQAKRKRRNLPKFPESYNTKNQSENVLAEAEKNFFTSKLWHIQHPYRIHGYAKKEKMERIPKDIVLWTNKTIDFNGEELYSKVQ